MVSAFEQEYGQKDARRVVLTGKPGEPYNLNRMKTVGDDPIGDAVVKQPVARDGTAQLGLATPSGGSILDAIVELEDESG